MIAYINSLIRKQKEEEDSEMFKKITNTKLKTYFNTLFDNVHEETSKIFLYMEEKINKFPELFENNLKNIEDTIKYLEKIKIPNNCNCASIIKIIPCWRCIDCTDYNDIYCSNCYIKSKILHKGHRIHFLPKVEGMCDCGTPNGLRIFCPDHKGPFTEQEQIDKFIEKSFPENILKKLKLFFDDFFLQFSKYLILTEQCTFFIDEILLKNIHNQREKDDAILLRENFSIVFQNFLTFLFIITNKNLGMLYLITNYLLKNYFSTSVNLDEKFKTSHTCIKFENKIIQILYENNNNNTDILSLNNNDSKDKHKCECYFLRLLLSNWIKNIQSKKENKNESLLLSFAHNIFLNKQWALLYFFIIKQVIVNNNSNIIEERTQFLSEENILICNQNNIIEKAYKFFYNYTKEILNIISTTNDKEIEFTPSLIKNLLNLLIISNTDINLFIKPKILEIINSNINIMKTFIDIACLFHNQCAYESIYPHPEFQEKIFFKNFMNCELYLIKIANRLSLCYNINNTDNIKEIFQYLINKILNQKLEGIKELKKNEFSFHLTLYRYFGILLNHFCLTYALQNNTKLIKANEYVKNNLFKSKEEMQKVIDLIVGDYFKMFGFITAIRNGYFNYYDSLENYHDIYFNNNLIFLKIDYTLIKYLLSMSEKKLNINNIFKLSNIENVYSFFNRIFKIENINEINQKDEDEKKHIMQIIRFFEILIIIIKNDTAHYYFLLTVYNDIISVNIKNNLFINIKKNENIIQDLKNNLRERLILIFITSGNLLDLQSIKNLIDDYYFKIFSKNEFFEILNELTTNKIENSKIIYSLKDSSFKYLDVNYYFSSKMQSKAEIYLNDFKKDKVKLFNSYFYKPSVLTYDFHNKAFENILLNIENIEFITKILEVLLPTNKNEIKNINQIKDEFLPVVLNYITILGDINSISFIKFKIENKTYFNKIINILNNAIHNNEDNILLDKELIENVKCTINKINKYQMIYNNINYDFNKLNKYGYNNDFNFEINKNNLNTNDDGNDTKNKKSNKIKEKYKNLIKQKRNNFIEKIQKDKRMTNIIEGKDNKNEKENDDIMCFFCRNKINLSLFQKPYGKIGNIHNDFFYSNSFRSSIKKELNKIIKNDIPEKIQILLNIKDNNREDIQKRVVSCGHYFHQECFKDKFNQFNFIKCPVCEKTGNALIPPLTVFYGNNKYLKGEKLDDILDKKKEIEKMQQDKDTATISEIKKYKEINISFIQLIIKQKLSQQEKLKDFKKIINELFSNYEYYLNYLGNLFYCDASVFHIQQQIDNIQNIILTIRYLIKIDYIDINQVIDYIRNEIDILIKGPNEKDNIFDNYKSIYYSKSIDKIIFLLTLLIDYEDIKKLYLYIINWSLPYLFFWIYLRNLIIKNNFYSLYDEKIKEKINIMNFNQFLNENTNLINIYIKLYLQKLLIIKKIIKFGEEKNKENFYKNIDKLTIENLFEELNIEDLYQVITKDKNNEINIIDMMAKFEKIIISENSTLNKDYIILDYNNMFSLLINNLIKINEQKYLISASFLYQFILYKFEFVNLENNIFDFIEKNLFLKCYICNKLKKKNFLCLICGNKICENDLGTHSLKCTFHENIFIDLDSMKLLLFNDYTDFKYLCHLYTNELDVGPTTDFISNEYNLNKGKLKTELKNFICLNYRQ